ncbi:PhlD [Streptomyces sp. 7N604]|uniref:PhlD n=1 Tax=Streptomyces sp. 7N604 TaxID=3457415 RepID=UPI003FD66462
MAFISRPAVILPEYEITTGEIIDDIQSAHSDNRRLSALAERLLGNIGVETRRFTRPLEQVATSETIGKRNLIAFLHVSALAQQAAQAALDRAGLSASDVDYVLTANATGDAVPGLDTVLSNALGLRPDIPLNATSQLGCAGGATLLNRAADVIRAQPHRRVLVVCAESLSSTYQHSDTSIESLIYKGLFGDAAAACLVTGTPLEDGPRIDATWDYLLRDSMDRYRRRIEDDGYHFDSTSRAPQSVDDVMPELRAWMATDDPWEPQFAVIHPGSTKIIESAVKGLGGAEDLGALSQQSLAQHGNLGGVSILDVLAKTFDHAPPVGDVGLLVGFGPGFRAAAARLTWCRQDSAT